MTAKDRKTLVTLLIYSGVTLAAAFAMAVSYIVLARVPLLPIYFFMFALSLVTIAAFGGAGLFLARGLPAEEGPQLRLRFTPARLGHAGFVALVVAGTGSVTAAGLGQVGWFLAAAVISAGYAVIVFAAPGEDDGAR
jgi:hypothetical protein